MTMRLGLAGHTAVAGARWTVRGVQKYRIDIQYVSTLSSFFLLHKINKAIAELEPCVEIHKEVLGSARGGGVISSFF